jgi:hypothetical protein
MLQLEELGRTCEKKDEQDCSTLEPNPHSLPNRCNKQSVDCPFGLL